jgi:hypothetical protein
MVWEQGAVVKQCRLISRDAMGGLGISGPLGGILTHNAQGRIADGDRIFVAPSSTLYIWTIFPRETAKDE